MTARKPATRKKATTARRKPVKRTSSVRKPRATTRSQKLAVWAATKIGEASEKHTQTVISRKDAAILRHTHEGCPKCKGNGQIFTKGKDGSFTGSKPCPAKPTRAKAGRMRVALAARFGKDKNTGLVGWTCPCGSKEKPRFRDAKDATKALRTHERKKHGGKTVGGAWYGQVPAQTTAETKTPAPIEAPVTKTDTSSTMTDAEWEAQNSRITPAQATKKGVCWSCAGKGALYSAFGGERITAACPVCRGTGKPTTTPATV
ncbi:hypothetical protein ABZ208_13805 [Streptomyces sp. NPDC006208]|uniref:hypothetical protein n=1 Tax=Streptomyces sp. NPDC006208 TaxID=3156734 RepID=UPI0033ACE0F1